MGDDQGENKRRMISAREVEIELLEKLKQKQIEIRSIYFNLVGFYSEVGRQDVAQSYLQLLLDATSDPGEQAKYLLTMGQLMEQVRDYPMALEYYQKAYALEPTDKNIWYLINNNMGFSLNILQRYEEGERFCREAIKINPQRHNAYKNIAISFTGLGKYPQAAENFIIAARLNPIDQRAFHHLIDLLSDHPELIRNDAELWRSVEELSALPGAHRIIGPFLKKFRKEEG